MFKGLFLVASPEQMSNFFTQDLNRLMSISKNDAENNIPVFIDVNRFF